MNKNLPDKHIRKSIFDLINNIQVDGLTIPCFDYRANTNANYYTLITTQSNIVDEATKCGKKWLNSTTIEVFTRYSGSSNPGSRLLADNILDKVRELTNELSLPVESNLKIEYQRETFPNDLVTITPTVNVFRKFIRYELLIN